MSGIAVKIFLGLPKTYEVKQALQKSASFKESVLTSPKKLVEIENEGKEYIGFLLDNNVAYQVITQKEQELRSELIHHCPKLDTDPLRCVLFSQLFIS